MEKSAKHNKFSKFTRLLIALILIFNSSAYAHYYSRYILRPIDDYVFEDQETTFEVIIPNLRPSEVLVTAQNLPDNVTFISSEVTEVLENNIRSVRIRITYQFEEVGYYKMQPIASRIRYGAYNLTVQNVTVLNNPQTIQPIIQYKLLDTTQRTFYTGDRIPLQLTVSFASRIDNFNVKVLEDSAIRQTQDVFDVPVHFEGFSDEAYPIANFEFVPLKAGRISVPQADVKVRTWKGNDKIATSETLSFVVRNRVGTTNAEVQKIDFSVKTDSTDESTQTSDVISISSAEDTKQIIAQIASLRMKEKRRPFAFSLRHQRRLLESQIGLTKTSNEFSYLIFYISFLLFLASIAFFITTIVKRKKTHIIFSSILLFFAIICILSGVYIFTNEYALILVEKINSVPEEVSNVYFSLPLGTKVRVKGITSDWIFITYGDTVSGWVKKDDLILLR